ncbi:aldose 1-epimerase [Clostridium sp. D5]|nr:aldose 1-epimerase [Clostridium sp. D5]
MAAAKDGILYEGYCGLSLETQFVPNAVNYPGFYSPVFRKEDVFRSTTIYAFSVRKQ